MAPPPPLAQPALPPMREVTEDTPPDMLAGAMDLRVLLPDGHSVKMNVDRSTPMMDLLVHVTTANKMSPGSHVIQAVGEKGNALPYKPSTPIGALDTWTIQIVSKSKANVIGHKKAPLKPSNQPFEQTFRLQVNLPRNQLFVTRVSPRTPLLEVLRHVCNEKGLDPDKYELRNPMNPDEVLRLTCNLLDYKLQEVTVTLRESRHRAHPAADIISQQQQLTEEKRRKSSGSTTATSTHSGGVFGFIFKRGSRSSVCEGSISSDSLGGQSISPARSDESLGPARSASPPLSQGPSHSSTDHLRNQINSRMNKRQENSCCPITVLKESGEQMAEGHPPPPPVRQRKRRAPKPPVLQQVEVSSGSKKTSDFITPAPPSIPAPIPVSRRKSTSVEDEEYEEEVVRSGGCKAKIESGGTSGTVISHSRNSSDSSGYHEASVLSESPESGLGGSGAPDTLPRRKQQLQQQRAAASASSQVFSRSMGNLAPPPSSNTLISTSYSSLSISTSSLPSQKKKKAPAPPPPTSLKKQQIDEESTDSQTTLSISSMERTKHDGFKENPPQLDGETVPKPKLMNCEVPEPSKPDSIEPSSIHVNLSQVDQMSNASLLPAVAPPASKPASASKLGPAVAPKPKVNSMGRPGLNNCPGPLQDAPIPKPRSKQPLSKKHIAPSPAPRSKAPLVTSEENEQEKVSKGYKVFNTTSGSSPLSKEEELVDTNDVAKISMECGSNLDNGEDELIIDDLNLALFDGGASIGSSNYEEQSEGKDEEEFDETVLQKILMKHQRRSFADVLNDGLEELVVVGPGTKVCSKSDGSVVEGFSLETNGDLLAEPSSPKSASTNFTEGNKRIHQVESALNFSNFSREGMQEKTNDFGRLSSSSLCSEIDMSFVIKSAKMNRWGNMEALNRSSSSVDMKENRPVDDSSNWVVGSESDNEAGEAMEAVGAEDASDFVNRTDAQQIDENLNDLSNKSLGLLELQKKSGDYDTVKADSVCTVLPSPPPSLEYMGPIAQEEKGTHEDLEWEYKLPAPPTGFEDEEDRVAEEVKEDTWVAESIPSTFSSSQQKVWVGDGEPSNHLPNFRLGTYKAPSSEGWEDPREMRNQNPLEKRCGSMFAMLNSEDIEREADREVDKNYLETWASVSTRSSVTSAPSSSVHTFNPAPQTNSGNKDGVRGEKNGLAKNGSYVVRVNSFGGKSSMNLKRSLSSTSSIYSRHYGTNGKDVIEKLDKGSVASETLDGNDRGSLSNSSRTVSLHDLVVNSTEEDCRVAVSLTNGYHKESTTPKIVSSTWKKPQGTVSDPPAKYPPPVSNSLRKTSSELSISQAGVVNGWKGDEDQKAAKLQFLHWHEQMLQNKSTLDGSVSLKSLQVLRGVLPQLKKSLSSDLADKNAVMKNTAKRKEYEQGKSDSSERMETSRDEDEILHNLSTSSESSCAPSSNHETSSKEAPLQEAPKRYSYAGPPSINFGTWSERPKSEVSLKCDSDYRIGVGQAPRAKEPLQHFAQKSHQMSQYEPAPPCPPPKPSNHVVVNIVSASKQEPISRLPIVRSVELKKTSTLSRTDRPLSGSFLNELREELTGALASLADANRNGVAEEGNGRRKRQQIPSSTVPPPPPDVNSVGRLPNQTTSLRRMGSTAGVECGSRLNGYGNEKRHMFAPVVKGFRVNSVSTTNVTNNQYQPPQPPPAPPPAVVALKKKPELSTVPKFSENPRDQLLVAIREFGGRESLKKTAINYK